jgi:hypothetical protein
MKKRHYFITGLALLNILIHFLLYNRLECHRDELFYYIFGDHPAFGYASTQPLIGFFSFLLIHTFGYSIFIIKLLPALTGGITVWLVAEITKDLGGKTYAQVLAAVAFIVTPVSLRTFMLYQPVFLDLLLWTLIFMLLIKYSKTGASRYLLLLGITAGFGLMNKYLIVLLLLLILIAIAFTRHRNVYTKKQLYTGLLFCMLIYLPNLIWQFVHHLPVIDHMTALRNEHLVHVNPFNFMMEQLLNPFAGSLLIVPGLLFLLINKKMEAFRYTGIVCLLVVLVLLLLRGKSYYSQGIYPILIAAGAVFYEIHLQRKWIRYTFMFLLILITIPALPIAVPVFKADSLAAYYSGMEKTTGWTFGRRFEDGTIHSLPQDFADMLGWEELTQSAARAYQMVTHKENCIIFCENYGQAAAISVLGKKYGLPEAISFNDSFLYWVPDSFAHAINEFIYVNDELGADVEHIFSDITITGKISNPNAREYGTTVYLCRQPAGNFNAFIAERIREERSHCRAYRKD